MTACRRAVVSNIFCPVAHCFLAIMQSHHQLRLTDERGNTVTSALGYGVAHHAVASCHTQYTRGSRSEGENVAQERVSEKFPHDGVPIWAG